MKTAIITGASHGIGAAIAVELLHSDYRVYGIGRDFSEMTELLFTEVPEEKRGFFRPLPMDLCDTHSLITAVQNIRQKHKICLLVNNAGVGYFGPHEELNPAKIHEMVTINIEIPMLLCQLLLRDLKETQGQIIQISSVTAKKNNNTHGCAYGATKAALTSFSSSLWEEVRKYGVRITTIHPDMTASGFYRNANFKEAGEPDAHLLPKDVADTVHMLLTSREGMVFTDLTLTPQKHKIERK